MIYGAIDEHSKHHYTYLKDVFSAINHIQMDYNWLITDTDIIARSEELNALNTWPAAVPAPEYYFLSGEALTKIVTQDDSQWIWGVLSGFDKRIPIEDILQYPLPKADGYGGFWKNPLSIQHALASIEIVPWDSSLVLIFSKSKEIVDSFRMAFSKSQDLQEYNAEIAKHYEV